MNRIFIFRNFSLPGLSFDYGLESVSLYSTGRYSVSSWQLWWWTPEIFLEVAVGGKYAKEPPASSYSVTAFVIRTFSKEVIFLAIHYSCVFSGVCVWVWVCVCGGVCVCVYSGKPLQSSCPENPMDRGIWRTAVHGVIRVGHDLRTEPPPQFYECLKGVVFFFFWMQTIFKVFIEFVTIRFCFLFCFFLAARHVGS